MREIFDRDTLKIVTSSYDTEDYEEEMRRGGCRLYPEKNRCCSLRYTV